MRLLDVITEQARNALTDKIKAALKSIPDDDRAQFAMAAVASLRADEAVERARQPITPTGRGDA